MLSLAVTQPSQVSPSTQNAIDRVKQIPPAFWMKLGIAVLALVAVVIVLRKVAKMNKVVLAVIVLIFLSTIGFNWIYERNEPAWATPVVEKLSGFFPTKGAYGAKQRSGP